MASHPTRHPRGGESGFYLYYPKRSQVLPKLRAFIEHIKGGNSSWRSAAANNGSAIPSTAQSSTPKACSFWPRRPALTGSST